MSGSNKVVKKSRLKQHLVLLSKQRRYIERFIGTQSSSCFPPLAIDHIKSWSNEGDIVGSILGSGTTAIASIKTKRKFIGFDISNEYCAF